MGKALGIIALVFGIVSLALSLFSYAFFILSPVLNSLLTFISLGLAVAGIICGAIGISKDDKAGLAIAGLIISSITIITFIAPFFLLIY